MLDRSLLALIILIVVTCACNWASDGNKNVETVFDATDVGKPSGEKVTKEIGPAGGTLVSYDGRLTITVPPDAVGDKVTFSIQPITNKVNNGLGNAYRLEPDDTTFKVPVEMTIRFGEKELEGTAPEATSLAFQDKDGSWHEGKVLKQTSDTLTVAAEHFTDWSFLSKMRLSPSEATVRPGESVKIELVGCIPPKPKTIMERIYTLDVFDVPRRESCNFGNYHPVGEPLNWYADKGTITSGKNPAIYTAPPVKPSPNVAIVSFPFSLTVFNQPPKTGMFTAKITIIDRGYRVSGNAGGDTVFEGIICDPEKPFKLTTTNPFLSGFAYEPSSSSGGSWKFAMKSGVTGGGGGTYTLEGPEEQRTALVMNGSSVGCIPMRCLSGGGELRLTLTPLAANEGFCN